MESLKDLKKELDRVSKELIRLQKFQEKQEDEGIYDDKLYANLDALETRKYELENKIDNLENL